MTAGAGTPPVAVASAVRLVRAGRAILDGVSLEVRAGTITLLVGPNGAGKTTLLRALSGIVALSGGRVTVDGRDPRRHAGVRASIGVVPQEIALYGRLTVRENVEVFAALAGAPRDAVAVAAILARTGLTAVGGERIAILSGGMQRRANLACALVSGPRLLLLDEPTVGLDHAARRSIGGDLRRLATEDGVAVLLATHDLDEGEIIADGVVVLKDGRTVAAGTPGELLAGTFPRATSRIDVALAGNPDSATASTLASRGFKPMADTSVWRGFMALDASAGMPGAMAIGLAERAVREIRIRRAGLEDAYAALMGGAGTA